MAFWGCIKQFLLTCSLFIPNLHCFFCTEESMSEVWYKKRALFPPVNGRLKGSRRFFQK